MDKTKPKPKTSITSLKQLDKHMKTIKQEETNQSKLNRKGIAKEIKEREKSIKQENKIKELKKKKTQKNK